MAGTIYILCALISLLCSILLLRAYAQSGLQLLLWSGICFSFLTADNVFLFADRIVWPDVDFALMRRPFPLIGLGFLIYGMVWKESN